MNERLGYLKRLFAGAIERYDEEEGFRRGAAFSYYATFSIFPLVLLAVTVVGFAVGDDASTRDRILAPLTGADPSVRAVLEQTLTSMQQSRGAQKTSAIVGLVSLLFSASGAFVELDYTLNKIWRVTPRCGEGVLGKVSVFVHERMAGLACVVGIGLFMVASLVTSSALGAIAAHAHSKLTLAFMQAAEVASSIVLLSAVMAAAFHFVPRSRPPFRDVVGGAVLTTVLLTILEAIFAAFLSHLADYSAYGVVGGVLALATWIYLSSQIIFFGATLTCVNFELMGYTAPGGSKRSAAVASAANSSRATAIP